MASLRSLRRFSSEGISLIVANQHGTVPQASLAGAVGILHGGMQLLDGKRTPCFFGAHERSTHLKNVQWTRRCLHTSTSLMLNNWERNNLKVYPPQKTGEPPRMAEVYYSRRQIKHSMRKMWYIATFVKGMMIDDALTQLQFINKKAAKIVREVLLEAQEEAVKNHNVEFKSNLHIAKSLACKGQYENAMRIHAKGRFSIMDLVYCHYLVCLREGPPPKEVRATGYDQAEHYMESLRRRTVTHSI